MAQRSHVPKFGNWESEENVPYTVYFDKARKGRTGGKMINPNDPQENPDMFPNTEPTAQAPPSRTRTEPEEPPRRGAVRTAHEHQPDRGAAVPKFGEWDESNPSSADGYTHIFNRVREERHTGPGNAPGVGNQPSYPNARKQNNYQNTNKSCCFL
ncbi:RPM1-interacting protein 4 [Camellia lanceoleosa]|uniref:RPM1-interacting protein 4 n=1 Tax=Camellia lanceoleosa TaxID=1840588 RepID=A0ACC0HQC0_9ERIC|nr:RPM1-interacting protein 4 [Camellia lanceoleosa]